MIEILHELAVVFTGPAVYDFAMVLNEHELMEAYHTLIQADSEDLRIACTSAIPPSGVITKFVIAAIITGELFTF